MTAGLTEGTVLHADLDAFFASVEQRDDPSLRGRPVIVGGGVVVAASYEAKRRGVRTPSNIRTALRACPEAVVVPPRFEAYSAASRAVFEVFADTTPLVEALSIDEAFLEVGGLRRIRGRPSQIAAQLRTDVAERVGLPISVGVARTKYLAKIASASAKPDGLLVVHLEHEQQFLHALPVERLWGVGDVTAAKLHQHHVRTVGQIAAMELREATALLGNATGRHLWALAQGHDPRRVETGHRRGSMGAQHALGSRPRPASEVEAILLSLVDRVTSRMRKVDRTGSVVTVSLRFGDFGRSTASHTMARPTSHTATILEVARTLLRQRWSEAERRGLTLIGVSVGQVDDAPPQLALPLDATSGTELDTAIDQVRAKFGRTSVKRAVHVGDSERAPQPILPD
ncbi:DNA polymerase IV [Aeromicrobium sp. Leaf350]|uniref:DNA polymerase IV n=1 Tax=Aeromicrobium sp. Leaf350 TaxID=2876565 RepID=UPI001E2BE4C7|nr:DNA polymerase IV [Aeromicrobium sp. Leaf350]